MRWSLFAAFLLCSTVVADDPVDFARQIRPILSDACFNCHGPDEAKRKVELRLDTQDGLRAQREIPLIVAGKAEESELIRRLTTDDESERMPPRSSGKTLTAKQVDLLKRWVSEGAKYSGHWAFTPPVRPTVPTVANARVANAIDAFVVSRLAREGLAQSAAADKTTLLRRLSLDLIGLPPAPAEVEAFLKETAPDAYERQVERLLKSPHYGERWGRLWLDAARYADSDGYEKDKSRNVWFYRDWVIQALNRDLPYDQFIIEQIAGDLLPNATQDQIVATGFLRNSMINEEGGIDPEQFRMEAMFDRMDAIGKSVLGLTIQCSQCHNHKYDPLTQEEYYRMFAFVNNAHEANISVYTPEQQQMRADLFAQMRTIEDELQRQKPDWREAMAAWEDSVSQPMPEWTVLRPGVDDISTGGQKYLPLEDGSLLAQGYAPTKHRAKFTGKVDLPSITAVRLELLNDPNLPQNGPGRSVLGTAALTEFEAEAAPADAPEKVTKVKFSKATASLELPETPLLPMYDDKSKKNRVIGPIAYALDGKDETAWGTDAGPGRRNRPQQAVFTAEAPIANANGTILTIYLKQNHGGWNSDDNQNCNLGRFRLSVTGAPEAVADPVPAPVRAILAVPREQRTPDQTSAVFREFRRTVPEWKEANERIEALWKQHPESSSQLVLLDRQNVRKTHLLNRGDFLKPTRVVEPGVPSFLNPLSVDEPNNRLGFARWLVSRDSPTTARSIVNRVWQTYFGTGFVSTSEDLGSQSETPSHPELLDWLAVEFMEQGWSLKKLHRLIVTSATYRQAANVSPQLAARDPDNRLLARGPRIRVDAETVRDIALAASGLLNDEVGGPSVYPPAPEFLFQPPASYGPKVWKEETGANRYRRALYTFRFRSVPYPALQAFDAPNGDYSCVRRVRSNTPLQALTTLNEPLFLECARALALKTVGEGGTSDKDRMSFAFQRCVAREPSGDELAILQALLEKQVARFSAPDAKPWELAAEKPESPPTLPDGVTPAQLAAWTAVSRVLLNLDETITKE